MDTSVLRVLQKKFSKIVSKPDLKSELPEQNKKHWENQGRSGTQQIIHVRLVDQPCEMTFSLFMSPTDEVIQTGIVIKYQNEPVLNEVRKGDALGYKETKRIDPVAFLKGNFATATEEAPWGPGVGQVASDSFTLEVDDDSEEEVFRAVEHLCGRTQEELKEFWQGLIAGNGTRLGKDQVSPIIKTWLKRERDRLDMQYLRDADLLLPKEKEIQDFAGHQRFYTVVSKRERGNVIREKVDSADPDWWGGMLYGNQRGKLVRVPHDPRDRVKLLKTFDGAVEFPVEEIFIDHRHIYSVVFIGEEALVFRTRNQVSTFLQKGAPKGPAQGDTRAQRLRASAAAPPKSDEEWAAEVTGEVHPFMVAKAEKAYMEALKKRTPELNAARKEFMELSYKANRWKFKANPEELKKEIEGAIVKALGKDVAGIQKEAALIGAHVTIFYAEIE